jgi:ABC-type dipeptide/oligopeptide/nickel transport system permease component
VLRYVAVRIALVVPVVLGAATAVFLLIHLIPGDAAVFIAGENASAEVVGQIRAKLGLDQPLVTQYARYMGRLVFHGDLGESLITGTSVAAELRRAFPNTVVLTLVAIAWSTGVGILLGVIAASHRGSIVDRAVMSLAVFGVAFPGFAIALGILYVLAFRLDWFPLGGVGADFWSVEGLRYLALPALAVGFDTLAQVTRMVRTVVLETLTTEYVRTARAKGLGEWRVVLKHAVRPGLVPVITLVGVGFARLLSGTVVVETVFAWPGIGRLVVASILVKDLPMIQGVLLLKAGLAVGMNLIVDVSSALVDPRVRQA